MVLVGLDMKSLETLEKDVHGEDNKISSITHSNLSSSIRQWCEVLGKVIEIREVKFHSIKPNLQSRGVALYSLVSTDV